MVMQPFSVSSARVSATAKGALGEGLELEHPHGAVPDDGAAVAELLLDHLGRLGAVVKAHPAGGDLLDVNDLGGGIGGELVGDNDVSGEDEVNALLLSNLLELGSKLELVLLNE